MTITEEKTGKIKQPNVNCAEEKKNSKKETMKEEIEKPISIESIVDNELNIENKSSKKELLDLQDKLLRALAEIENVRKRAQKDLEEARNYSIMNFSRDILSVQDNLCRALESIKNSKPQHKNSSKEIEGSLLEGIKLTVEELSIILGKHGIKEVNPLHLPFDSYFHQAMFEEESEEYDSGIVTQVFQVGYTLKKRLLRPAMVVVSKKKS